MGNQGKAFRKLLQDHQILVAPGVIDAMTARIAAQNGFESIYLSGSLFAASLGFPDTGLVTLTEAVNQTRVVTRSVDIPLIVDAESGFGDEENIKRTVTEFEDAGAAAFHIEDQLPGVVKVIHAFAATSVDPKGSSEALSEYAAGGSSRRLIYPKDEMVDRIKVAVAARRNPDTVVIGRTDAMPIEGIDGAIERANAYADAGADLVVVQLPRTVDEVRQLVKGMKAGLVISTTLLSHTGVTTAELGKIGVKVVLAIGFGVRAAWKAMDTTLAELRAHGTTERMADAIMSFNQNKELSGEATLFRAVGRQ